MQVLRPLPCRYAARSPPRCGVTPHRDPPSAAPAGTVPGAGSPDLRLEQIRTAGGLIALC